MRRPDETSERQRHHKRGYAVWSRSNRSEYGRSMKPKASVPGAGRFGTEEMEPRTIRSAHSPVYVRVECV